MSPLVVVLLYGLSYAISIMIGWFTINPICYNLGQRYFPDAHWDRFLPRLVGSLEQTMYITAFILGYPEFVAVWLVLKLAGEWRQTERQTSYAMYNIFLIGNSLSLILSVLTALLVSRFLPPLP